jgi:hypothetical protein
MHECGASIRQTHGRSVLVLCSGPSTASHGEDDDAVVHDHVMDDRIASLQVRLYGFLQEKRVI